MDGSSNRRAGRAGVVIQTLKGDKIKCMIQQDFPMTNNEAEYEALVAGLDLAKAAGAENVVLHCDSQVVTGQINGDYECKNEKDEEVSKRSEESNQQPRSQIRSNPKGGKRMCRPSSKSCLSRIYACPRTSTVIYSKFLTYWRQNKYAGSRPWKQLGYATDIVPKN